MTRIDALRGFLARHDVLAGAAVCLFFALAFARTPILHLPNAVWSPADISQVMSLTRVTDGWRPGNELLSDVWLQMHAWVQFQREELWAGRMPLWNPWNGNGVPQLANFQCAVLSPFSVPYYLLPFALAVVTASVAKLFALAFFTFLFLRELRLAFAASILGAIVFAYAGHNVVLLGHPHSGVAALMPAAFFLVERVVRRSTAGGPVLAPWRAFAPSLYAWLVGVLVLLQLAGHPETLFFALAFVGLFAAVRLASAWQGAQPEVRRRVEVLSVHLLGCALLAALIGSIQTLPFFEYLRSSAMLEHRTGRQIPLGLRTWSTLLFPDLLGNPSKPYYLLPTLPRPDFTIATMAYVGGTATLAALCAFLFVRRRRACAFFAGGFALWFVYAYDVGGIGALWDAVPLLSLAPINRSQPVGAFCIATLAAFTAHFALERGRSVSVAAFVVVLGGAVLWLAHLNAGEVVELVHRYLADEEKSALLAKGSAAHLASMTWILLAGTALLAALWLVPRAWMRVGAVWGLVLVAYAQSGAMLKGYMPLCDPAHFYPVTPAIEQWRTAAAGRDVLVLGNDTLPPCSNMMYRLRQAASYDALGIRRYERLYAEHFGHGGNWMLAQRATTRGLQLFGIGAVIAREGSLQVDPASGLVEPARGNEGSLQTFRAEGPVGPFTLHGFEDATARFHVVPGVRVVADGDASWEAVHAPGFNPSREFVLELDPSGAPNLTARTVAGGETARVVTLVDEVPGRIRLGVEPGAARWLVMSQPWYPGWRARVNGAEEPIRRANHAFGAVVLPETACEVVLEYEPVSFRIASWLALGATLLAAAWLVA